MAGLFVTKIGSSNRDTLKYDARSGSLKIGSEEGEKPLSLGEFIGLIDLENIMEGWISFTPTFDDSHMALHTDVANGTATLPFRPGDNYRTGFKVQVMLPPKLGGGVKEFMSSAQITLQAVDDLYQEYTRDLPEHPGQVPAVKIVGTTAIKGAQGTNFKPIFKIVGWHQRPAALVKPEPIAQAPAASAADDFGAGPATASGNALDSFSGAQGDDLPFERFSGGPAKPMADSETEF